MQFYKNNAHALLSRILSILNLDWLQHARSVRGVYELKLVSLKSFLQECKTQCIFPNTHTNSLDLYVQLCSAHFDLPYDLTQCQVPESHLNYQKSNLGDGKYSLRDGNNQ